MADQVLKGVRAIPVPYNGKNLSYRDFKNKMGLSFLGKSTALYAQSIKYKTLSNVPERIAEGADAIAQEENELNIVVFLNQSLSGDAAKIMQTVICLPDQRGYKPFPGSRILLKLNAEYGEATALSCVTAMNDLMALQFTTVTQFSAEVEVLQSVLHETCGYQFPDALFRGKILHYMFQHSKYESICRDYAEMKVIPEEGKDYVALLNEIRKMERFEAQGTKQSSTSNPSNTALLTGKNAAVPPSTTQVPKKERQRKTFSGIPCPNCVKSWVDPSKVTHTAEKCFLKDQVLLVTQTVEPNPTLTNTVPTRSVNGRNYVFMTAELVDNVSPLNRVMFDTCANIPLFNPHTPGIILTNVRDVKPTSITGATASLISLNPTKIADVTYNVKTQANETISLTIKDANIDEALLFNIVPAARFTDKPGNIFTQSTDKNLIKRSKLKISDDTITIYTENKISYMKIDLPQNTALLSTKRKVLTEAETYSLHQAHGHLNYRDLQELVKDDFKMHTNMSPCNTCLLNKGKKNSVPKSTEIVCTAPGQIFYLDLSGRSPHPSYSGCYYIMGIRDLYSGTIVGRAIKSTNLTGAELKSIKIEFYNSGIEIKLGTVFRCDQDNPAFRSPQFLDVCKDMNIHVTYSPPYMHQYMGIIERSWYTLFNMGCCMFSDSPNKLPLKLWVSAIIYAIYVHNRTPKCNKAELTPAKILNSKDNRPIIRYGTSVVDLINKHHVKMTPRGRMAIFIGYSNSSKCALLYHPDTSRITESINYSIANTDTIILPHNDTQTNTYIDMATCVYDTEYLSEIFPLTNKSTSSIIVPEPNEPVPILIPNVSVTPVPVLAPGLDQHVPLCVSNEPTIPVFVPNIPVPDPVTVHIAAPEYVPIENASIHENESEDDDIIFFESATPLNNNTHSNRTSDRIRADTWKPYNKNATLFTCTTSTLITPTSMTKALQQPDENEVKKWRDAQQSELDSLNKQNVYTVVHESSVPTGTKIINTHLILSIKPLTQRYKVRLVANGNEQDEPNPDNYSPVPGVDTLRSFLSNACEKDMHIETADVDTAYLNADLLEPVYCYPPKSMPQYDEKGNRVIWRLVKALYGLGKSGQLWNNHLDNTLTGAEHLEILGFKRSENEPCLYIKDAGTPNHLALVIWVDDIVIAAKQQAIMDAFKEAIGKVYKMKYLGQITSIAGIEVTYNKEQGIMTLSQIKYIETVLNRFNMRDCSSSKFPAVQGSMPLKPTTPTSVLASASDAIQYREIIGSLMWLTLCTAPGLAYYVSQGSKYVSNPSDEHIKFVKHLLRHVKYTINNKLTYRRKPLYPGQFTPGVLTTYSDADWASDPSRKSTSGYIIMLNGGPISYSSQSQKCIALSVMESELIATVPAAKALIYHETVQAFLGNIQKHPLPFYEDNQSVVQALKHPVASKRTKHIDIKYFFLRSKYDSGYIDLLYVPSENNLADIFTKDVSRTLYERLLKMISGL